MERDRVLTIILAGGAGERLWPLTRSRCKPAVPFGGSFRVIDFTLMNCLNSGASDVHILTQYKHNSLSRHLNERWSRLWPLAGSVKCLPPKLPDEYIGTADAVYKNLDLLARHRPRFVLVLSGDHIYRADYRKLIETHLETNAKVTVLTDEVATREASSFGVLKVSSHGEITRFVEKPADALPLSRGGGCTINLGVYCFDTNFLVDKLVADARNRKSARDFGKDILPSAVKERAVAACLLESVSCSKSPYWRDVGTIESLFQANMDLLRDPPPFDLEEV